ncbi:hypothetical protein [Thermoflexibacter ruber]|uniref:hypothetical protein n=1 Tax=Thermoflexibacter ruber TaxID=1003 RepID=UPI0011605A2E|nr:hypothetical protein [Thermoflexibacter ruber]
MILLHYHSRRLVSNLYLQLIKPSIICYIWLCANYIRLYLDLLCGGKAYAQFLPCGFSCMGYGLFCNCKVGLQILNKESPHYKCGLTGGVRKW